MAVPGDELRPLFWATLSLGTLLAVGGAAMAFGGRQVEHLAKSFPRSRGMAVALMLAGGGWFLWRVLHLGEADFGNYRLWLLAAFAVIGAGSFFHAPEFLAVRGACILSLLAAGELLAAAFMQDPAQRLLMVSTVYVGIALCIWLAVSPFRVRDFLTWVYRPPARALQVGIAIGAWGLLLAGVAFTY